MSKDVKFKAGKKGQHESGFSIRTYDFTVAGEEDAYNEEISTSIEKEMQSHIDWLKEKLSEKGLPEDLEITYENVEDYCALAAPLTIALESLESARMAAAMSDVEGLSDHSKINKWKHICRQLLRAIPNLITVQSLLTEGDVIAGRSRADGGNKEKARIKEERIMLAEPIFNNYRSKNHSKTRASELTAKKLLEKHDLDVSAETIRHWFKGKK